MSTKLLLRIASLIRKDIILTNIPLIPVDIADPKLAKQASLDYNKLMYYSRRDVLEQVNYMLRRLVDEDWGVKITDVAPVARKLVRTIEANISKKLEDGISSPEGTAYYTTDKLEANMIYPQGTPNTEIKNFLIEEGGIKALRDVPDADFDRAGIRFQLTKSTKSITLSHGYKISLLKRISDHYTDLSVNKAELQTLQDTFNKRKVGLAKSLGLSVDVLKSALEVSLAVSSRYEGAVLRHRKQIKVNSNLKASSELTASVMLAIDKVYPDGGTSRYRLEKNIAHLLEASNYRSSIEAAIVKNTNPDVIRATFNTDDTIQDAIRIALLTGKSTKSIKKPTQQASTDTKLRKPTTAAKLAADKAKLDTKLKSEAAKLRAAARQPQITLRDLSGKFQSTTNLIFVLSALNEQVAKNMERPHLEYQTGRFANSVAVNRITKTREGAVQVFYTYMKYPYQTFEPGYRQGHKGYDPRILIDKSIRDLITPYLRNSLMTIRE
jgi:hypothetical protein